LRQDGFNPPDCLPRYWEGMALPEDMTQSEPFELTVVAMPPEMFDVFEDPLHDGEGLIGPIDIFAEDVSL
jgi:hypothetical protein